MTALERRYRNLLRLYPKTYRDQRGEEIISTVLEPTNSSNSWPTVGNTIDLVGHALRLRIGVSENQPIGRLLLAVGPGQLVLASLMSFIALIFAEWSPSSPWPWTPPGHLGPFFTAGPIVYFGWILAGLSIFVDRPRLTRRLVFLSIGLTAVMVPIGHLFGLGRPAMYYLLFLVILAVPYAAVPNQGSVRSSSRSRTVMLALPFVPAILVSFEVVHLFDPPWLDPGKFFYRDAIGAVVSWVTWLDVGALVIAVVCIVVGREFLGATIAWLAFPWVALWTGVRLWEYASWKFSVVGIGLSALSLIIVGLSTIATRARSLKQATQ